MGQPSWHDGFAGFNVSLPGFYLFAAAKFPQSPPHCSVRDSYFSFISISRKVRASHHMHTAGPFAKTTSDKDRKGFIVPARRLITSSPPSNFTTLVSNYHQQTKLLKSDTFSYSQIGDLHARVPFGTPPVLNVGIFCSSHSSLRSGG